MNIFYFYVGEKPKQAGQEDNGLAAGSIAGIIMACLVTALLIITLTIAAVFHECKKQLGKVKIKSKEVDLFERSVIHYYSYNLAI